MFGGKVKIKWYLNAKSFPIDQGDRVIKGRRTSEGLTLLLGQNLLRPGSQGSSTWALNAFKVGSSATSQETCPSVCLPSLQSLFPWRLTKPGSLGLSSYGICSTPWHPDASLQALLQCVTGWSQTQVNMWFRIVQGLVPRVDFLSNSDFNLLFSPHCWAVAHESSLHRRNLKMRF